MLLHTYAEEEPDVLVLNYAPGPVDTDMQYEARTYTADKDLKDMFTGQLLSRVCCGGINVTLCYE